MRLTKAILSVSLLTFLFTSNVNAQCGATAVDASPQPVIVCEGSAATIDFIASGNCTGGSFEYEVVSGGTVVQAWTTSTTFNASPTTTTTYFVNARCSACPGTVVQDTFTVNVIEDPTVTGTLNICPGNSTTLNATTNVTDISWWSQQAGGTQLSTDGNLTTPVLNTTTTYWVHMTDTVGGGGGGSVLITECGLDGANGGTGSEDYIEVTNLYNTTINTAGWVVAVSASYTNINSFNSTMWNLPNTFAPCSVQTRTDHNGSPNYWGNNIFWNSTSNSWAIIIDDQGNVVDFIAWGWTAAQLATFNPTINGFPISLGTEWIGNGCALPCGSAGGVQYSFARNGSSDSNTNGDFVCQPTSVDLLNPGLNCGWTSGTTCTYPVTVVVDPQADATIDAAGPLCVLNTNTTMTAADPGGVWSGTGITDSIAGTFDASLAGVGTHTITYMINSSCGDTATFDVVVEPADDATITPVPTLCLGSAPQTLVSQTAGGTWSGTGITDAAAGTFEADVAGSGTHTITYITFGPCPDTATLDIDVYDPLMVQAYMDTAICDGATVTLTSTGSGGDGNHTYTWTDQGGNQVGIGSSISVTPSTTTTYTVTLNDGCTTPTVNSSVTVIVYPIPTVTFYADSLLGCSPLEVNFVNTSSPTGTTVLWDFGNGETSDSISTTQATFTDFGCYDISLTITQNGCTNSATMSDYICVAPQPIANWTSTPATVDVLDPTVTFINHSTDAEFHSWDFDDGTGTYETDPVHVFPYEAGGYNVCLVVSNSYGCLDTLCGPITVDDLLLFYIPNTFTPDGDEYNQTLQPIFSAGFDPFDFTFRVFNRWGEVIWESNDASVGWDGTYNGRMVQDGTYTWTVEFKQSMNDARVTRTGSFNLIR